MTNKMLILTLFLLMAFPFVHAREQNQDKGSSASTFNTFYPTAPTGQAGVMQPLDPAAWSVSGQTGAPVQNWSDPSAWMAAGKSPMRLNLAHPAGWAAFINPYSHTGMHTALMNPATHAQFMQPHFWMQFLNPDNLFAWMNPASYATFLNPSTYMGWWNPAAYMHVMSPSMYMQPMNPANYMPFLNPATYLGWMNPAAFAIPGTASAAAGRNGLAANAQPPQEYPPANSQQGHSDSDTKQTP